MKLRRRSSNIIFIIKDGMKGTKRLLIIAIPMLRIFHVLNIILFIESLDYYYISIFEYYISKSNIVLLTTRYDEWVHQDAVLKKTPETKLLFENTQREETKSKSRDKRNRRYLPYYSIYISL